MAKPPQGIAPKDKLELYEKLVATNPKVERKWRPQVGRLGRPVTVDDLPPLRQNVKPAITVTTLMPGRVRCM